MLKLKPNPKLQKTFKCLMGVIINETFASNYPTIMVIPYHVPQLSIILYIVIKFILIVFMRSSFNYVKS